MYLPRYNKKKVKHSYTSCFNVPKKYRFFCYCDNLKNISNKDRKARRLEKIISKIIFSVL